MSRHLQYSKFLLEAMVMFITLIVVIVTQEYMYIPQLKLTKLYTLIICPFLYTSYTSIEIWREND